MAPRFDVGKGVIDNPRTTKLFVGAVLLALLSCGCGARAGQLPPPVLPLTSSLVFATASPIAAAGPTHAAAVNVYASTLLGLDPVVTGIKPYVYVPNSDGSTLTVIDPSNFSVVRRIGTGSIPHHVAPAWDLSRLYVDEEQAGKLMVIDPRTARPVGEVHVPDPYNLYFSPDGRTAIVVEEGFRRLEFRDPTTWGLRATAALGPGLDHLDFSADGSYLLVTAEWSGEVFKVDSHSGRVLAAANVGGLPIDVRLSPDGSVFFIANQGRMGVSVFDATTMRELSFIATGRGAHGLYLSRDTRSLYVSNRLEGSVSVIDVAARAVRTKWMVGGSPDMLQLNADGAQLWMSSRYDGYVMVVDTHTGRVVARIYSGPGAHGLSYFPAPGHHSLGHNGVYR
ncbi:MAG: beta-propeller fold lactonase family protein [Candidatus Dormibacteria bacterium]